VFTGLIETIGVVRSRGESHLEVEVPDREWGSGLEVGESIAVNGACLTAIEGSNSQNLVFDVSPESFARTALGALVPSSHANLERAMRLNERLGGHIVLGHVDATGELVNRVDHGSFTEFVFRAPSEYDKYLIDKGSVAVDGISLTVVQPERGKFSVWIIPATLLQTNLQYRKPGERVNLEFDVLAKHVEKLLASGSVH
jgi:riboflavin synthase